MENVRSVVEVLVKRSKCLKLVMKQELSDHILRPNVYIESHCSDFQRFRFNGFCSLLQSKPEYEVWFKQLSLAVDKVERVMSLGPKAFQCRYLSTNGQSMQRSSRNVTASGIYSQRSTGTSV